MVILGTLGMKNKELSVGQCSAKPTLHATHYSIVPKSGNGLEIETHKETQRHG